MGCFRWEASDNRIASRQLGPSRPAAIAIKPRLAALLCLALCLGGCSDWEQRHGIDPIISPAAVEVSTSNQMRILEALARDASIQLGAPAPWYEVTQAGFNYVDDECRAYFNAIFFLNRDKDQLKSGLAAAGATTAAVLGVTGASAKSIAIVAQAFGLGVVSTDLVAGTYLYQMPPSVAQGFVKEMQLAYRDGAASRRLLINTPSSAYHAIQDYLSLCLPPTIEAKISEHVAGAKAIPDPTTGNGNASFGITVATPQTVTRAQVRQAIIGNVETPLPRPPVNAPVITPDRMTDFERSLSTKDIMAMQAALCVPQDGKLGPIGSQTRLHFSNYLVSIPPPVGPLPATQMITDKRIGVFATKLMNSTPSCPP
jgi:hypothetical protein